MAGGVNRRRDEGHSDTSAVRGTVECTRPPCELPHEGELALQHMLEAELGEDGREVVVAYRDVVEQLARCDEGEEVEEAPVGRKQVDVALMRRKRPY